MSGSIWYALFALAIMSVMIDRFILFLEKNSEPISWLPDKFEPKVIYILVFITSYIVCWISHFSLFIHFGGVVEYTHVWYGYLMTSLLLSGGSKIFRESLGLISSVSQIMNGGFSSLGSVFSNDSSSDLSNVSNELVNSNSDSTNNESPL